MNASFFRISGAVAAALFALTPAPVLAVILDFSQLSNAPYNLQNYDPFPQSVGDTASANFSYRTLNGGDNWGLGASQSSSTLLYWRDQDYSGDNAVFSNADLLKGELRMDSLVSGGVITSITFDFGAWPDTDLVQDFRFYDGVTGNFISIAVANVVSGTTGKQFTFTSIPGLTSIVAQWGDDWNVGLRSVQYELSAYNPDPVPLPAALPLLASGLVGYGLMAHRRRKRSR